MTPPNAAPLERPLLSTPQLALAGVLHAEPDAVFAALAARLNPADDSTSFTADASSATIVVQGTWWYRGEWRVLSHEDGTRIEHEVINVARPGHWAGAIAGRRAIRDAPQRFHDLISHLAAELEENVR